MDFQVKVFDTFEDAERADVLADIRSLNSFKESKDRTGEEEHMKNGKATRRPVTAKQRSEDLSARRATSKVPTKKGNAAKRATISPSQPHSKTFGH